jgi:hypothetical protein
MTQAVALTSFTALTLIGLSAGCQEKGEVRRRPPATVALSRSVLADKNYTIDLTASGKIYGLPSDVDMAKVRLHTLKGNITVAQALKNAGKTVSGPIRVGTTSDFAAQFAARGIRPGHRGENWSCSELVCVCQGDEDCDQLFTWGPCGSIAVC